MFAGFASLNEEGPENWSYAMIVDIQCPPAGSGPFGELKGGYLTLLTCGIPDVCGGVVGPKQWGQMKLSGDGIQECVFQVDALEDVALVNAGPVVCIELKRAERMRRSVNPSRLVFRSGRLVEGGAR